MSRKSNTMAKATVLHSSSSQWSEVFEWQTLLRHNRWFWIAAHQIRAFLAGHQLIWIVFPTIYGNHFKLHFKLFYAIVREHTSLLPIWIVLEQCHWVTILGHTCNICKALCDWVGFSALSSHCSEDILCLSWDDKVCFDFDLIWKCFRDKK